MAENGAQIGTVDDLRAALNLEPKEPVTQKEQVTEPQGEATTETGGGHEQVDTSPATEPQNTDQGSGEQVTSEPNTTTEPTIFDIKKFNETYSTEFTDESELKSAFEKLKRTSEIEEQLKELESVRDENLLLKENLDPMKYFSSEEDFKIAQFRKQFPDKDASVAYKAFSTDLSTLDDKQVLVLNELLDNPGVDEAGIIGVLERKYGVEDWDELDSVQKTQMKIDANKARKGIDSLKGQIKLPEKIDVDSLAQQQKELLAERKEKAQRDWSFIAKEVADSYPDLVIKDKDAEGNEVEVFKYGISEDFPKDMVDSAVKYMVDSGVSVTEDAVKQMASVFRKEYIDRNINNIVRSAIKDTEARLEEERLKKQHNPGTPTPQATPTSKKDDVSAKIADHLNSQGFKRTTFLDKS